MKSSRPRRKNTKVQADIMNFLNSDFMEQDNFFVKDHTCTTSSFPSSFFNTPFENIRAENEVNAATPTPESFRSPNGKRNAQASKRKLLSELDSHETESADSSRPLPPGGRRATNAHNLSEKRRRTKINEKLKDLQLLIPNSKRKDIASILGEAIKYVQQLQLQVKMLSSPKKMNASGICIPVGIPCIQMPQMCMNTNMEMDTNIRNSQCNNGFQPQVVRGVNEGNMCIFIQ